MTYTSTLPLVGQTIQGTSFETNCGGKGANQIVQCARLNVKSGLLSAVGKDSYGGSYLNQLIKEGVDVSMMKSSESSGTGTASICVDEKGQNFIIIVQGANLEISEEDVRLNEESIQNSNILLCQNEIPLSSTIESLKLAKKHKTISILNPAPADAKILTAVEFCDIICPNEVELSVLTGLPTYTDEEIQTAAAVLLEKGCKAVIVTLGARGAYMKTNTTSKFFTTSTVEAIDTVGAGDSFIGSLASSIARGSSLNESIERALFCASVSVTRKGAQKSYANVAELEGTVGALPPLPDTSILVEKEIIWNILEL